MAARTLPNIRRRLAGMLYEIVLLTGVLAVAFLLPHLLLGAGLGVGVPGPVLLAHVLIVVSAYFLWYWRHGGTLAMQTWKLRLESAAGGTPSLLQIVVRYLVAWFGICFYGAGLFWALFDRDRQFLHDRLAGTRIAFRR